MNAHVLTPSSIPLIPYLVLDDFGRFGRAYVETDERKADLEAIDGALMTAQHRAPVRVIAFNVTEDWVRDFSGDVAREVCVRTLRTTRPLRRNTRLHPN